MVPPASSSHYFDSEPSTESDRSTVELVLPDLRLTLTTDRGVFARDQIDTGTKLLLLDGSPPNPDDRLLVDLGAGYGPIACVLAARNPQATVWAVEINARARTLCRENAERAGLTNLRVIEPTGFPLEASIDRLWSNPPVRIGKPALHQLLMTWLDHLVPNGSAHFVMQRHLGADSLHRWLADQGWVVARRGSKKAFRLLDIEPRPGVRDE